MEIGKPVETIIVKDVPAPATDPTPVTVPDEPVEVPEKEREKIPA